MLELIYPYDIAPVLPPPTAETSFNRQEVSEWFPVVEPGGIVVGRASRQYCHGGEKPLHPVVHIHIAVGGQRIIAADPQCGKFAVVQSVDRHGTGFDLFTNVTGR